MMILLVSEDDFETLSYFLLLSDLKFSLHSVLSFRYDSSVLID